ncbi:unnamed protein product, partial [Trichobilharzia szidati]
GLNRSIFKLDRPHKALNPTYQVPTVLTIHTKIRLIRWTAIRPLLKCMKRPGEIKEDGSVVNGQPQCSFHPSWTVYHSLRNRPDINKKKRRKVGKTPLAYEVSFRIRAYSSFQC